jgi:Stage II sporulation protein E (SpoIIE)
MCPDTVSDLAWSWACLKSVLRMRARAGGPIGSLLDDIHAVLMPLKQPHMFVTVACVRGGCGNQCMPGDLFALLTDGLIEVFNRDRDELGFDWAKGVLRSSDGQPLSAIANRLLTDARAFGAQLDDQTVLLIRRMRNRVSGARKSLRTTHRGT